MLFNNVICSSKAVSYFREIIAMKLDSFLNEVNEVK